MKGQSCSTKKDRQIFRYFNGVKEVKGDPLILHRKLLLQAKTEGHDIDELIKVATTDPLAESEKGNKPVEKTKEQLQVEDALYNRQYEAIDHLTSLIRSVFNLKPLEEDGLTETEVVGVLGDFIGFHSTLKKNTVSTPNSLPSTDSPQSPKRPSRSTRVSG